jgi:hypothetical protein
MPQSIDLITSPGLLGQLNGAGDSTGTGSDSAYAALNASAANAASAAGLNPNYMARIVYQNNQDGTDTTDPGVIAMFLPETFQLNFSSSFDQPFSQGLVNMPGLAQAAKMFGASLTSQSMSVQVWQGTTCPQFNLTFQLIAENDSMTDIILPIKRLSKLCLPGQVDGLLTPPGPRLDIVQVAAALVNAATAGVNGLGDALSGVVTADYDAIAKGLGASSQAVGTAFRNALRNPKNNVSLWIGKFLHFPSVVLDSVSQTYDTVFDKNGLPIKATVDITFSTWFVPIKADVEDIFQGAS